MFNNNPYQLNLHTKFKRIVKREIGLVNTQSTSSTSIQPLSSTTSSSTNTSPTPIAPIWEYSSEDDSWTKFDTVATKILEGLAKRSRIFTINIASLGQGFSVNLDSMKMLGAKSGKNIAIRRNPPLPASTIAPVVNVTDENEEGSTFSASSSLLSSCKKLTSWKVISPSDKALEDIMCVICYCPLNDPSSQTVHLSKCPSHYFHADCIASAMSQGFLKCPVCLTIYGVRIGTQPHTKATMKYTTSKTSLPGHEGYGHYVITYTFADGIQGPEHPSPGETYYGTSRTAYLPASPEGTKVLSLLKTAWDRRLVFTVGTSVTTGQSNCVIWNGIHHKTSTSGGPSNFGYPDPTYLERVKQELADKGVE